MSVNRSYLVGGCEYVPRARASYAKKNQQLIAKSRGDVPSVQSALFLSELYVAIHLVGTGMLNGTRFGVSKSHIQFKIARMLLHRGSCRYKHFDAAHRETTQHVVVGAIVTTMAQNELSRIVGQQRNKYRGDQHLAWYDIKMTQTMTVIIDLLL